jgi:hypothetical protein
MKVTVVLEPYLPPTELELENLSVPPVAGVLLGENPWPAAALAPAPGPKPAFVRTGSDPTLNVALTLARTRQARELVLCPEQVSPAKATLALAVARLLAGYYRTALNLRDPVITSPDQPRCRPDQGQVAVPHNIAVITWSGTQRHVIWEILRADQLPAWHAALRPSPPSAQAA